VTPEERHKAPLDPVTYAIGVVVLVFVSVLTSGLIAAAIWMQWLK
jgi:hypothetical protein